MRSAWCIVALLGCDRVFGLAPVPDADLVDVACPNTYSLVGARHYRLVDHFANWPDAEVACVADGAQFQMRTHLVVLSPDEYDVLDGFTTGTSVWVGLTNQVTLDDFKWVTDEDVPVPPPHMAPWLMSEPTLVDDQRCVERHEVGGTLGLADAPCVTQTERFVCECDLLPEDPSHI